jgi:hypothetical protein
MPRISIPTKGLSSLAQAIMSGQDAAAQGFDEGMGAQAKTALAMQQIKSQQAAERAHDAEASLKGYQAQGEKASLDAIAPDALRNSAMIEQGIPLDDANAVDGYLKTGKLGGRYGVTGDDGVGPVLPAPEWAGTGPNSKLGSLARSLATMQQAIGLGDKNVENVAKAGAIKRTGAMSDAIINGGLARNAVAGAEAAVKGGDMYDFKEFGTGDKFTGAVDSSGPVATRYGQYRDSETTKNKEQAGAAKANAAESYAGVGLKKAQAAKTQQEIAQGKAGSIQQTDNGMVIVDTRTGTARPVMGLDGKPLQGKAGNLTEGERKAATLLTRLRGSQDQLMEVIGANPDAAKPRTTAEFVRAIPWVGGDTAANLVTPEARQRVEAAQLDMLDAALTLGTGAAYTNEQLKGYAKSYFPQLGDSPKTISDKKVRLANVIRAAEIAAGKAEGLAPKSKAAGGATGEFDPASDVRSQADAILKGSK